MEEPLEPLKTLIYYREIYLKYIELTNRYKRRDKKLDEEGAKLTLGRIGLYRDAI